MPRGWKPLLLMWDPHDPGSVEDRTRSVERTSAAQWTTSRVVDHVTRFYLESGDFNGVPAWQLAEDTPVSADRARCLLASLIRKGKLSAVFADR